MQYIPFRTIDMAFYLYLQMGSTQVLSRLLEAHKKMGGTMSEEIPWLSSR
jgi:hypothetical protein